ncbi:transglutaminase domain-containing protein [Thermodesulfobacteriota bacterium]
MNSLFNFFIKIAFRRRGYILLPLVLLLISGCAGKYFRDAGEPPSPSFQFDLSRLPYTEYWTGIVFNGNKIGFSHFTLLPSKTIQNRFDVRAEVALRIRFLALDKQINLKSYDRILSDLSLDSFEYQYNLDGNRLKLSGRNTGEQLEIDIFTQSQTSRKTLPLKDTLYPTSIIALYPVLHGLEVGRTYTYTVYDGETQTIAPVTQKILAYEESDLFPGQAFKIKTRLHGQEVTTWIDANGRPLLEMSLGGVIISALESKSIAERYLTQAALNKNETLLDFSLIKSNIFIPDPGRIAVMEIRLSGIQENLNMPVDERQQCERRGNDVYCKINAGLSNNSDGIRSVVPHETAPYLAPSYVIPSQNPQILQIAKETAGGTRDPNKQIHSLLGWIQENIEQAPVDVFTAMDVLEGRKAECQGISLLYAAFARSLGIPTRIVNGIMYASEFRGFLYHAWAESFVSDHWIAVDPTFQQAPADATHVKFIEGEKVADLIPMADLIGKIQVQINSIESQ